MPHNRHEERELHLLREELALTKKLLHEEHEERKLLLEIIADLKKLLPHPTRVQLKFGGIMAGNPLTLNVGQSSTATVTVLDQFGQTFPFDFTTNVPVWAVDNTASVGLAAGATPDAQSVSGVAAGTATLTVDVPGVTNGHDEETVTVVAPAPVATSVKVSFTPPTP